MRHHMKTMMNGLQTAMESPQRTRPQRTHGGELSESVALAELRAAPVAGEVEQMQGPDGRRAAVCVRVSQIGDMSC